MMVWEYFTHFHKSPLCYTDVHVYRATSQSVLIQAHFWSVLGKQTRVNELLAN